ncbi:hypothetical protein Tco_0106671, partial [Tanacetum coccineum]
RSTIVGMEERALAYWSTCFISDRSFSKLETLSLNLNTKAKSGRAESDVVVSEAVGVGVGVGVACCDRGFEEWRWWRNSCSET